MWVGVVPNEYSVNQITVLVVLLLGCDTYTKQAGAELGQAQPKLGHSLKLNFEVDI